MRHHIHQFVFILFVLCIIGILSGCSDQRSEPPTTASQAYTATIPLWMNQVSNGQWITQEFTVDDTLATINRIGVDAPARLFIWGYIQPDADIRWRESIVNDSLPVLNNRGIGYQIKLDSLDKLISRSNRLIDSLELYADSMVFAFDSTLCDIPFVVHGTDTTWCDSILFLMYPDSMVLFEDTTGWGQQISDAAQAIIQSQSFTAIYTDSNTTLQHDSSRMGTRRDSIGYVVDDRYTLSLWFDDAAEMTVYPEALYQDSLFALHDTLIVGQEIHLAETNSTSGMKGRKFEINLASFDAADIRHIGRPLEIVWTCSPGSVRCLSSGHHTIGARLTGSNTRITATLVLVYHAEQRP